MTGYGVSGGALSIINGISSGYGAAMGINLATSAVAEYADRLSLIIDGCQASTFFLSALYTEFTREYDCPPVSVSVTSSIPQKVGLKSSSAAGNAILLAFSSLMGVDLNPFELLKMNARASKVSGVSVTGAYDDAAACLLGGIVFADNISMNLEKNVAVSEEMNVDIVIPSYGYPSSTFPIHSLSSVKSKELYDRVQRENCWYKGITENGKMVADALQISNEIADSALKSGAVAAGISGTGPAVVILVNPSFHDRFLSQFSYVPTIQTQVRNGRMMITC